MSDEGFFEIDAAAFRESLRDGDGRIDDATFLARYRSTPLIIRGLVNPPDVTQIDEKCGSEIIGAREVSVYTGSHYLHLSAAEFARAYAQDLASYNLLEGVSRRPEQAHMLPLPDLFLDNWIRDSETSMADCQVILATTGCYTRHHSDVGGSATWILLLSGEKHWTVAHPRYKSALYSPRTRIWWDPEAPHAETLEDLPLADLVPTSAVTQRGGDLIWMPPGWSHRVRTTARSHGISAFYLHPAVAVECMRSYIAQSSWGLPTNHSLPELLIKHWLPQPAVMDRFGDACEAASRLLAGWQGHQNREPWVYPDALAFGTM